MIQWQGSGCVIRSHVIIGTVRLDHPSYDEDLLKGACVVSHLRIGRVSPFVYQIFQGCWIFYWNFHWNCREQRCLLQPRPSLTKYFSSPKRGWSLAELCPEPEAAINVFLNKVSQCVICQSLYFLVHLRRVVRRAREQGCLVWPCSSGFFPVLFCFAFYYLCTCL